MGGNALSTQSLRISPSDYEEIGNQVKNDFAKKFNTRALIPKSYKNKADFGDIDILIERENILDNDPIAENRWNRVISFINEKYNSEEIFINKDCLSFGYPFNGGFVQIDLISTLSDDIDSSYTYFSYNDLGNLVGRIVHKMGFIYGHQGLIYSFKLNENYKFDQITITKDLESVMEFLGFDISVYRKGFDTKESMFDFVIKNKYFNPEIFLLENRNHRARTRDRKRATYKSFLKYIEPKQEANYYIFPEDKSVWLPIFFERFPSFKNDYERVSNNFQKAKQLREKFNGKNIHAWTGLKDKDLGNLIYSFKNQFNSYQDFEEFILSSNINDIKASIVNFQKKSNSFKF